MSRYFKIRYQLNNTKPGYIIGTYPIEQAFKEMDKLLRKLKKDKFVRINTMLIQNKDEKYFMEILN